MFCTNCGSENPDNLNYCTNCGMAFNNASQYQQVNVNYQSEFNNEQLSAMEAKKFRKIAREKLAGKWGNAAILTLIFFLCTWVIALILSFIPFLGTIAFNIISPVLSFGLLVQWIKIKNGEEINYLDFFTIGFNNFVKVWGVQLRVWLKQIVPLIMVVVGYFILAFCVLLVPTLQIMGVSTVIPFILIAISFVVLIVGTILLIPLQYKYMFCFNELAYDNNRTAKEIVEYSGDLMIGKRTGFFWLQLTFIGWILLGILYIPLLWIVPYMQIASIIYYEWASERLR